MKTPSTGAASEEARKPDPFAILGLNREFEIDPVALKRAWLSRTAGLHPDRPDAPPDATRRLSELNDARRILENPELRASALMSTLNEPPGQRDQLPGGFLMEMLEIREALEAAQQAGDAAEVQRLREWAQGQRALHIERFAGFFHSLGQAPPGPEQVRALRADARKRLTTLRERVDAYNAAQGLQPDATRYVFYCGQTVVEADATPETKESP